MCGIGLLLANVDGSTRKLLLDRLCAALQRRGPDTCAQVDFTAAGVSIALVATVLHMRGDTMCKQPVMSDDGSTLMAWNGEIFGGVPIASGSSDTPLAVNLVAQCDSAEAMAERMGQILGPYAFVAWKAEKQTVYFARDPLGRRSLLMSKQMPTSGQPFMISSVGIQCAAVVGDPHTIGATFEELAPRGIYSLTFNPVLGSEGGGELVWQTEGRPGVPVMSLRCQPWPVHIPHRVSTGAAALRYIRTATHVQVSDRDLALVSLELLRRLSAAVRVRCEAAAPPEMGTSPADRRVLFDSTSKVSVFTALHTRGLEAAELPSLADIPTSPAATKPARVAVLFSGGLDSMVLAALASQHVPRDEAIDLLNVCFAPSRDSPDRLAALAGLTELRALAPWRTWQLVCVDADYARDVLGTADTLCPDPMHTTAARTMALLAPCSTHMDFNIGSALWHASRGIGFVDVGPLSASACSTIAPNQQLRYGTEATVAVGGAQHHLSSFNDCTVGPPLHAIPHDAAAAAASQAEIVAAIAAVELGSIHLPPAVAATASHYAEEVLRPEPSGVDGDEDAAVDVYAVGAGDGEAPDDAVLEDGSGPRRNAPASADPSAGIPNVSIACTSSRCPGHNEVGEPCAAAGNRKCPHGRCRPCCLAFVASQPAAAAAHCPYHCQPSDEEQRAREKQRAKTKRLEAAVAAKAKKVTPAAPATPEPGPVSPTSGPSSAAPAIEAGAHRVLVHSRARVLLLGIGADEQLAGYGRHRTSFRHGGWQGLADELRLDAARLWRRNLGRDDRVCSDHGKEVRLPFLDEAVGALVRSVPLPLLADLSLPHGVGDKRVLRVAGRMLGLGASTCLVKRAIHFGTRIAKQSNIVNFGSNRAARGDVEFSLTSVGPPR